MEHKVKVVILNAFRMDNLKECLESVGRTEYPNFEVMVVDFQTAGIDKYLGREFPDSELLSLDSDVGPSAMHNLAIKSCERDIEFVAFLDSDTVVEPKWLREMVDAISADAKIGAAQAKILLYDKKNKLNTRGNLANFLAVGWPDGFGENDGASLEVRDISFPSGAAMILRKEAAIDVGMFDEDFFIYADDLDFGLRLRLAGYRIISCPSSRVYHKYGFMRNRRGFFYLNRNRIWTFLKLYDKRKTYVSLLPAAIAYELSVATYAATNGLTEELLRCYLDAFRRLGNIREKRKKIKIYRSLSDLDLIKSLEGGVRFAELRRFWLVTSFLNPFLDRYRDFIVGLR